MMRVVENMMAPIALCLDLGENVVDRALFRTALVLFEFGLKLRFGLVSILK